MQDKIIIRPMYSTDKGYLKGWMCAVLESNGDVIARHSDTGKLKVPDIYKELEQELLDYDDINWKLAGYDV